MKTLLPALFGFALLGIVPAAAQSEPMTTQQLLEQHDAVVQNQTNAVHQAQTQTQLNQMKSQAERDQLFANQPFTVPPQPIYIPPSPPPVPKPKP